jgi:hypothetical protein
MRDLAVTESGRFVPSSGLFGRATESAVERFVCEALGPWFFGAI